MQPLPELGRAYLVMVEPGFDRSRLIGMQCNIMALPGVIEVVDVAAISRETLDLLLLPDEYKIPLKNGRKR